MIFLFFVIFILLNICIFFDFFFCSKIYNAVLDRSLWQIIYNK